MRRLSLTAVAALLLSCPVAPVEGEGEEGEGEEGEGEEGEGEGEAPAINLLANPSLETWTDAASPNTTPDAWTNCTVGGGLALDAVPDSCTGEPVDAAEGIRFGRAFDDEGIAQTLATTVGRRYSVSFRAAAMSGCFGGSSDASWQVLVDDAVVLTTPSSTSAAWSEAAVAFTATASATVVCFRKTTGGQGAIDALSVLEQ